jgi:hypothetical protein
VVAGVGEQTRLEHRFSQFLDEQRHPVGLGHDLRTYLGRQSLLSDHPLHHRRPVIQAEPGERQRAYVRLTRPRRREIGSEGDDHQHRQVRDALDGQGQKLLRRRVDPVHVLVDHQNRLVRRERHELVHERFERQLLLALRGQIERRVTLAGRHAEQRGDQRHRTLELVRPACQQSFQLVEARLGRITAREGRGALQMLDHRMQRAGLVIRGALVGQPDMRLAGDALAQLTDQTRLADAGLAGKQHHLAFALAHLPP